MPRVSVIIPNYNHSKYLAKRIDSVLRQNYQDFEVIILDDKSSDDSREVIELYRNHPKVSTIIYNDQNSGSTFRQWNKGVQMAGSELIWIAESDDLAKADFLEKVLLPFNQHKELAISYCQSHKMDSEDNLTGDWSDYTAGFETKLFESDFVMEGRRFIREYLLYKNVLPNASAIVFKKSIYDSIGMADVDIKYCSDWLLWMKMLAVGDLAFCSEKLNYFRYHNKSVIATATTTVLFQYKFDILMRIRAQQFLKTLPALQVSEISAKNKTILSNQALNEAFFFFKLKEKRAGIWFFKVALVNSAEKLKLIRNLIGFFRSQSAVKSEQHSGSSRKRGLI